MPKIFPRYREKHMSITVVKQAEYLAAENKRLTLALLDILVSTNDIEIVKKVDAALHSPNVWQSYQEALPTD